MRDNHDVVKRWVNEVQQAINSRSNMVQYHALGLLYHVKQRDRLAIAKLVTNQMKGSTLRSPYAYCLLIRYASKVGRQLLNRLQVYGSQTGPVGFKTIVAKEFACTCLFRSCGPFHCRGGLGNYFQVIEQDPTGDRSMFEFLESCLRNKSEMVIYEAARAIVNMSSVTARDLSSAISGWSSVLIGEVQPQRQAARIAT